MVVAAALRNEIRLELEDRSANVLAREIGITTSAVVRLAAGFRVYSRTLDAAIAWQQRRPRNDV